MAKPDNGRPFVNFSRPQRTPSLRSMASRRSSVVTIQHTEEEDPLPYRPVKCGIVKLHVTTNDAGPRSPRPLHIPERTTSINKTSSRSKRWLMNATGSPSSQKSSIYTFASTPTLTKTAWEREREKPGSRRSRVPDKATHSPRKSSLELPREIYQCILHHLGRLYAYQDEVDVSGWRRDLRSLCLVETKWNHEAREHLYRELWLPSCKPPSRRKFSTKIGRSSLSMLVETLEHTHGLGFMVHHIRIPAGVADALEAEAYSELKKDSGLNALRDVILQCYNLEQISGYVVPATPFTTPILEALASRTRLKSHVWSLNSAKSTLPGLETFIFCHDSWINLETLVLAGDPGVDLGIGTISAVLQRLPSLRNLMISGLHHSDFRESSLLTLPPVKSLRLENLQGLTDVGIEQLAFSRLALSLESLTLVDLELVSLQSIQVLLSHLTRLKRFALVQDTSPEPRTAVSPAARQRPLCSPSLQHLHWDCLRPGVALTWIAEAIEDHKFPRLAVVKVPADHDGLIQRLCRPVPRRPLKQSDVQLFNAHGGQDGGVCERNLRVSQIQAQLRVRDHRQLPSIDIVVQDEDDRVRGKLRRGTCAGSIGSRLEYSLDAEDGWLALADLDSLRPRAARLGSLETRVESGILFGL